MTAWVSMARCPRAVAAAAVVLCLCCRGRSADEVSPRAFIEQEVERVERILALPADDRLAALGGELDIVFDLAGFAHASMGSRWGEMSPPQQARLRAVLRRLIENCYLRRSDRSLKTERFVVRGELRDGTNAVVQAVVLSDEVDVDVSVALRRRGPSWVVCDLVVDELSLLDSYRTQFMSFLKDKTLEDLLQRLEAKAVEPLDGGVVAPPE